MKIFLLLLISYFSSAYAAAKFFPTYPLNDGGKIVSAYFDVDDTGASIPGDGVVDNSALPHAIAHWIVVMDGGGLPTFNYTERNSTLALLVNPLCRAQFSVTLTANDGSRSIKLWLVRIPDGSGSYLAIQYLGSSETSAGGYTRYSDQRRESPDQRY